MNYLRCHDDIGWGLDEAVENRLGIDPQKHKEYLYHFYEGNFPGSWAKGELYNYDPATGDARSCGTTASLCGVEQALEKDDKTALDNAVKRDLLLHTAMAFLQGFPMLNCGDEIAQRNGWDYKNDPDRVEDSRNLHRSKFNWTDAKQRTRKGTLQNQLWQGMEQLRQMRADPCFAPDAWVTTWDSHNPACWHWYASAARRHWWDCSTLPSTRQGQVWTLWAASIRPQMELPSGWRMWNWNPIRHCW